jgi:hypothetical protein
VAVGHIPWDPEAREIGGRKVRQFKLRTESQKTIRVTVGPEYEHVPLKKGDFVAVEGRMTVEKRPLKGSGERELFDLAPSSLAHFPAVRTEEEQPRRTRDRWGLNDDDEVTF